MRLKIISLFITVSFVFSLFCDCSIFAYDGYEIAEAENYYGTSLVEQGAHELRNSIDNYRFCYAYDYDGDGMQEGYALSGVWEEGLINGYLWFIDSDGTYKLVKDGIYCSAELFKPILIHAGKQIFIVFNQKWNDKVVSMICGCRNDIAYFPMISERTVDFHSEGEHYYAYDTTYYSGAEFYYDEASGEFIPEPVTSRNNIDIAYLTKYYWGFAGGTYSKYKFYPDGTYTQYDFNGNVYKDGERYSLENNILTLYSEYGESKWLYIGAGANKNLSDLSDEEYVFYCYATDGQTNEYIYNTHEDAAAGIKVLLNGEELEFAQPPIIKDDRTLVPMRAIFEAMGASVEWDGNTKTVTSTKNDLLIRLSIGDHVMLKNGVEIYLDVPAQLIGDYTMVPIRAVAEAFGAIVEWDGDSQTVYITNDEKL